MLRKGLSTKNIVLISVGIFLLLVILWCVAAYNGLIRNDENVNEKWGNVQADYQRRVDLIPNLISTVQASADFEKNMQTEIAALRTGITRASSPAEIDFMGQKINTAINLVYENYPQIRSTENYLSLQDQLEGTENRIKYSRTEFNNAVKSFNIQVRKFPTNLIAGIFGFGTKTMFESQPGAENVPNVGDLLNQ